MRCLCCGTEIGIHASDEERLHSWHRRCTKKFFGTTKMPKLDLNKEKFEELANAAITQGLTVPGVQKKLSLHLSTDIDVRLTIVDYPAGYILKPQTDEYEMLPEFEDFAMRAAKLAGIQTVPHALIKNGGQYAYITRRIDRNFDESGATQLYAMEDFCQLSERLTIDKYKGSYEKCGKIVKQYSQQVGLDLSELFLRVVFSYVIGNSDMHLKNFSLIEDAPGSRKFFLSAAYDMLPVNIVLPEDNEELALTLNGKKRNIHRKDFLAFAQNCEILPSAAEKMMSKLCHLENAFLAACDASYLSDELKSKTSELISERIYRLK